MEQLIKRWEEQYRQLVDKAEQYRNTNEHNFKKLTYKALQLKYCIKDLREQCAINGVFEPKGTLRHRAKALTKEEVEANRSNAYKYLGTKPRLLALIFSQLENILKISENKFGLYCFCIYICITIIN